MPACLTRKIPPSRQSVLQKRQPGKRAYRSLCVLLQKRKKPQILCSSSNGVSAVFAGSNSDAFLNGKNENFSIADISGFRSLYYRGDSRFYKVIVNGNFNPNFVKKIVFGDDSPVVLRISALLSTASGFAHRHLSYARRGKCVFDVIKFFRLNYGNDKFHVSPGFR